MSFDFGDCSRVSIPEGNFYVPVVEGATALIQCICRGSAKTEVLVSWCMVVQHQSFYVSLVVFASRVKCSCWISCVFLLFWRSSCYVGTSWSLALYENWTGVMSTWIFFGNQKSWLGKWAVFRSAWLCASWLSLIALAAKFMDLLINWGLFRNLGPHTYSYVLGKKSWFINCRDWKWAA